MGTPDFDNLMKDLEDVLIDDDDPSQTDGGGRGGADHFDTSLPQAPNANDFSNARLIEELEARKLRPTGFRDQDIMTLQKALDEEFEVEKETLIKLQKEKKEQAAKQAGLQRKRMMLERQLKEEKAEIEKNHRVEFWLSLVKQNSTPPLARIEVNSITSRALAKAMWTNTSLTSLDLSCNGIDDFAGAYIARLLKRNTALVNVVMGSNKLGVKACRAFGESLCSNATLKHLCLESNPLTCYGEDISGIETFASMLANNKSLTSVNLWRCTLGPEAGIAISKGMQSNHFITFLEIGHNGVAIVHQQLVQRALEANVKCFEAQQSIDREEKARVDKLLAEENTLQDQLRMERELREWLEDQKNLRAEERRRLQEK
ncbi:unnamed protein product, partial [Choristocarpus tenellus]